MEEKRIHELTEEEKKQKLAAFYMDIDCLDKLNSIAMKPNIFHVLNVKEAELKHSDFLAWILDPNENHGFGDKILKRFIKNLINAEPDVMIKLNLKRVTNLEKIDFYDFTIKREHANIDLLIASEKEKIVFVIENKVYAEETGDQLQKYFNYISNQNEEYKNYESKIFIYLTPDGRVPRIEEDDKCWISIDYSIIKEIIEFELKNIENGYSNINERTRIYLQDYYDILRSDIMNQNDEIQQICADIYKDNKVAIDLLVEFLQQGYSYVAQITYDYLRNFKEFDDEIEITSKETHKAYISFTTKKIRELMKDDKKENPIFQFTITNGRTDVWIAPYLTEVEEDRKEKRTHYYNLFNKEKDFRNTKTESAKSHTVITGKNLLNEKDLKTIVVDEKSQIKYKENLKKYIIETTTRIKHVLQQEEI